MSQAQATSSSHGGLSLVASRAPVSQESIHGPPRSPLLPVQRKCISQRRPLICASLHLLRLIYELQQSNVPSWLRQQQISEPSLLGCKLPCTSSTYFLYSCPSTVSGPGIRTQPLQSTGYLLLKCTSWGMELSTYSQSL